MITVANNGGYPWRDTPLGDEALQAAAKGSPELRSLRDRLARQVIAEQQRAGCDWVTDGLVRRDDPVGPIATGLSGMEAGEEREILPGGGRCRVPIVRAEVAWKAPMLVEDYLFAAAAGVAVKPVLLGPFTLSTMTDDHAYGDVMSLAMALAAALNQELRALQTAGVRLLQIDEPVLPMRPEDFPTFTRIWEVLGRGVQAPLMLHLESGSLESLLPGILRLKRLSWLSCDGASTPGNLALLSGTSMPDGVGISLGMVSGDSPLAEEPEAIAAALRVHATQLPRERIQIGTARDLSRLTSPQAYAKLAALDSARRLLQGS